MHPCESLPLVLSWVLLFCLFYLILMLVLVSFSYILFYYSLEACLSSNDRKGGDLNGKEGVEELGGVEGGTILKMI